MKAENYSYDGKTWSSPIGRSDSSSIWLLLFGAKKIITDSNVLIQLNENFPNAHITGCSTSGEIDGVEVNDDTVSVMKIEFQKAQIKTTLISLDETKSSLKAGAKIAKTLDSEDLKSIFIISDGLNVNGTSLVKGVKDGVSSGVIISGGLAGDGDRFESTRIVSGTQVLEKHIVAVGIYGESVEVSSASCGGWQNFGPERVISKSEENILYELDGRPALDVYKEYLGEAAKDLPSSALLYPLSIKRGEKSLVRTVLSVCEDTKSMTFAGDVPEGYVASLMHANFDSLVDGAIRAYEGARDALDLAAEDSVVSLVVSCVGRKLVMGSRVEDETETASSSIGCDFVQSGFYSYGEIGLQDGDCGLHNQTYTLTLLKESV